MLLISLESGRLVGLAILVSRSLRRHGFISSKAIFLNKSGDDELDEITIEYNGILAEQEIRGRVTVAAIDFLIAHGWDEVFIDAAIPTDGICEPPNGNWILHRRKPWVSYGVDLHKLRDSGNSFLETLSAHTRRRMRRALTAYGELGPMRVEVAESRADADSWFSELRRLHQLAWERKGLPGAFANPFLDQFHAELVARRIASGEIQILRVGFGERWIGYLYNFIWNGVVHNYQAGLDYSVLKKRNWPGAVLHYASIDFNCGRGAKYYDFLGGDNQLKRSLSDTLVPLDWMVARRNCMKFQIEDGMRSFRDRLPGMNSVGRQSAEKAQR